MAATVTLKVKVQDTVHRVLLQSHQLTYEAVADTIQEYMAIAKYLDEAVAEMYPGEVIAKYFDEEGDLRVLSADTFSSFLGPSVAEGGDAVLGLELFPAVPALADAQLAEWAGPNTAQALYEPEDNDAGADGPDGKDPGDDLRERQVATGFEDFFHSLSSQCSQWSQWVSGSLKSSFEDMFRSLSLQCSQWSRWASRRALKSITGKGKGKSKCKGSHAGADVPDGKDPGGDLRERQVATGFEDFFLSLSSQCSQWSQWVSRSLKCSCEGRLRRLSLQCSQWSRRWASRALKSIIGKGKRKGKGRMACLGGRAAA